MEFYHSFSSMKAANMDAKITSPKSFVITMLKILEQINTWGASEDASSVRFPYLYVDTSNLKRAFIVKSNQIVSFAFPFAIYTKKDSSGKEQLYINYRDIQLDDQIISYAMSIAQTLDLGKSSYAAQAKGIDLTDVKKQAAVKVFEVALTLEPSYIRYDYDPDHASGQVHPLYHYDVNYSKDSSYKLGLYRDVDVVELKELLDNNLQRRYASRYSSLLRLWQRVTSFKNRNNIDNIWK